MLQPNLEFTSAYLFIESTVQPTLTPTQLSQRNDNIRIILSTVVPMGVALSAGLVIIIVVVCAVSSRKRNKLHMQASPSAIQSEVASGSPLTQLMDDKSQLFVYSDNQAYASNMQTSSTDTAFLNCEDNPSYAMTGDVQDSQQNKLHMQASPAAVQPEVTSGVPLMRLSDDKSQLFVYSDNQAYVSSMQASSSDAALGADLDCKDNPSYATTGEVQDSQYEYVDNEASYNEDYQYDYIDSDVHTLDSKQVKEEDHTYY